MIVQIIDNDFDDTVFEMLVAEWLRTTYAPQEYRIQYQLLKTGGSKKDMDVYGRTVENEKLIVQVSNTSNKKTISNKIKKLEKYVGFKKLFFFNVPDEKTENHEIISLERVISDLRNDEIYRNLVSEFE